MEPLRLVAYTTVYITSTRQTNIPWCNITGPAKPGTQYRKPVVSELELARLVRSLSIRSSARSTPRDGKCQSPIPLGRVQLGGPRPSDNHSSTLPRRSALPMTETELMLIAAPAMIGLKRSPKKGNSTPAAMGMPSVL